MRRSLSALFVAAAAAVAPSAFAAGVDFGQEPPASVLVLRDSLEWAWAAPCSNGPGSCGAPSEILGFRNPTQQEWADSFIDRADLIAAFTNPTLCASPWLNSTHSHCDVGDLQNGHIWHAFANNICDPAYFNGCEAGTTETFLVRAAVPEPETLALMLTGLGLGTLVGRRRQRQQQS